MDTVPDREFISIFERVSTDLSLKGCQTPEDVERKMKHRYKEILRVARRVEREKTKRRLRRGARLWNNLLQRKRGSKMNFPDRVIFEAYEHPKGIIALTLAYGKAKASRILLKRMREKLRFKRMSERGSKHRHIG